MAHSVASPTTPDPYAPVEPAIGTRIGLLGRLGRGVGALSLGATVNALGQVSLVPVALLFWGKGRYGEWLLLTGLVSLLRFTDLGLQTFVVNRLGQAYARSDLDGLRRTLWSALRVQVPLVTGILVIGALAVSFLPIEDLIGIRTLTHDELAVVALLLAVELLLGVPMGVVGGVYRATGHLPRSGLIGAIQQLAIIGVSLAMIALGAGFQYVAAARVAVGILASCWIVYDLRRLFPWFQLHISRGVWREGLAMVGPGVFFLLVPLADYLSTQVGLLVVQRTLEPGEVSRLATHRTALNVAQLVSGILMNAAWPELTALCARGRQEDVGRFHRSLARVNLWVVGMVSLTALPLLPLIYPSWTAGRLSLEPLTLVFLEARLVVWSIWSASLTVLLASNRHRRVASAVFGGAIVSSILTVFLVPTLGIAGAALASLLGDLVVPAWLVTTLAAREIGDDPRAFVGMTALAAVKGLSVPALVAVVSIAMAPAEIVRLVIVPIGALFGTLMIWRQLWPGERAVALRVIENVVSVQQLPSVFRGFLGEQQAR